MDPVIAADGRSYERNAMEAWVASHRGSSLVPSPATGAPLPHTRLLPNLALRHLANGC